MVQDSKVRTLRERTRWAQGLIAAGKHALENTDRDVAELDRLIGEMQAKRERLLRDHAGAPAMIRRGEEELAAVARTQRLAQDVGYSGSRPATATALEKKLAKAVKLRRELLELEREIGGAQ